MQGWGGTAHSGDWSSTDVHAWARWRTADLDLPTGSEALQPQLPPLEFPLEGVATCIETQQHVASPLFVPLPDHSFDLKCTGMLCYA